jgi:hypothetical protein
MFLNGRTNYFIDIDFSFTDAEIKLKINSNFNLATKIRR